MNLKETNILFFIWFETYSIANNHDDPFKTINTSTTLNQVWEQINGEKSKSIYPPVRGLKIKTPHRQIIAIPFKTGANKNDKDPVILSGIKYIYKKK